MTAGTAVTAAPVEIGKEAADNVTSKGRVMFELGGVNEATAREALRLAANKLPIKCKFVMKETEASE